MGKEQQRRRQRNLKTVTHIVNRLKKGCIIDYELKIYPKGDQVIVDVYLAHFINTIRHKSAISQISAQLAMPMLNRHVGNFYSFNYFDWAVESDGDTEGSECFIRFTIYPKLYIPFMYCNKCGKRTKKTYDGKQENRICPSHRIIPMKDCTLTYKLYKRLPKKLRGIKWVR